MKSDFRLSNLVGTVYRQGNLVFTEDGTKILSPVGNRVSCFDMISNKAFTFSYQHRKNIACIALNKQATLMLSVDEDGRGILVNFVSRVVLHHFNFKGAVHDLQFSNDGHFFTVALERFVQIWKTPDYTEDRQFAPFVRHRNYAGHFSDVISVTWSQDSRFIISTAEDMTTRIFSLHTEDKAAAVTMTGHRDYVMRAFFDAAQETIYTLSKDGALFQWEYVSEDVLSSDSDSDSVSVSDNGSKDVEEMDGDSKKKSAKTERSTADSSRWRIVSKNYFHMEGTKVSCADFHAPSNTLVVGFTSGEFRLYELPEFNMIQQLSMGQNAVDTVTINNSGEWLAFGSAKAGQLLVYEWKSESYILKQQGHYDTMNAVCYSPDGSRAVTASDDGKLKVWDIHSGFCLYTFTEHTGAVTAVEFAKKGNVLFSASMDGTVRAWDLVRFRNFRTFTAPQRMQFTSMAVDPSGEIVVAGSQDEFEIYVWSVQTGSLLDSLAGHEGPISCLAFGTENSVLASSSWDKTIRIWNIFGRSQEVEPIEVEHDVLALAVSPDSKQVAVSTLNGSLVFYDMQEAKQIHILDVRKDVFAGRHLEDRFELKNSVRAKHFTTISYSFDGLSLIAGGNNNSICLYDIRDEVLLRRFVVSENMSLDGTLTMLNSSKITDAGVSIDTIDTLGEAVDRENRIDRSLPGSHRGDPSVRSLRPQVRVSAVRFSPTSSAFAAASTEGLLIFSTDSSVVFDPFNLDMDVTPQSIAESLAEKSWVFALVMAFRLNETKLIDKVVESIPVGDTRLVCADLPTVYVDRLLKHLAEKMTRTEGSQHIEFSLLWVKETLSHHGKYISEHKFEFQPHLRTIKRFLAHVAKEVVLLSKRSGQMHSYLVAPREVLAEEATDESTGESEIGLQLKNEHSSDDEMMDDAEEEDEAWEGFEEKPTLVQFLASGAESDSDMQV